MQTRQGKNIVICLDGTGNQFRQENTNVVKLYQVLLRDPQTQVAFYDPGVGTLADPSYKTPLGKQINKALGLGFGVGLLGNVAQAYTYLMEQYEEHDRVFIFGFSRGAYTARVLAGLIRAVGLLERGCENLIPYALALYKARKIDFAILAKFKSTYGRKLSIHFLGLWDSVSTFGWIYDPVFLPYTSRNSSVQAVRHALAIDERRAFFQPLHWRGKDEHGDKQTHSQAQDLKEVWFAGVHADVGGGYPEAESGLAKIALRWMIEEARSDQFGLLIDETKYDRYVPSNDDKKPFVSPNPTAMAHESLTGPWWLVQYLPQRVWVQAEKHKAIRMPPQRRAVDAGATLHRSVLERVKTGKYKPVNLTVWDETALRERYTIEEG
jgi:uncharacterized protein (DUF2235 family)